MTPRKHSTTTAIILAAILAAGGALRLCGMGERGFWLDEAYSEVRTRGTLRETIQEALAYEGSPPLYLVVLYGWRQFVGTGEMQFRTLSALMDGLTILAVFALARQMLNRAASMTAAAMYAMSSFAILYAQEARQYALLTLLVVLSSYFFYRIAVSDKRRQPYHYILYVVTTTAALYTFPYAVFVFSAQFLCVLVQDLTRFIAFARGGKSPTGVRPGLVEACLVVSFVLFSPYLATAAQRGVQSGAARGAYAGGLSQAWETISLMPGLIRDLFYGINPSVGAPGWVYNLVALLLAVGPVALGISCLRGLRWRRAFLICTLAMPFFGVLVFPFRVHVIEAKHFIFLLPLVLIAVCSLFSLRPDMPGRRIRMVPALVGCAVLAVFAATNVFALEDYYERPEEKEAWREVAPALAEKLRPGDAVIFSPFQGMVPFEYYLPDNVRVSGNPYGSDAGRKWVITRESGRLVFVDVLTPVKRWSNLPEYRTSKEIAGALKRRGRRRVWLVTNHSNVAREAPAVSESLENALSARYTEVPPDGLRREYAGGVGTIRVRLFVADG